MTNTKILVQIIANVYKKEMQEFVDNNVITVDQANAAFRQLFAEPTTVNYMVDTLNTLSMDDRYDRFYTFGVITENKPLDDYLHEYREFSCNNHAEHLRSIELEVGTVHIIGAKQDDGWDNGIILELK